MVRGNNRIDFTDIPPIRQNGKCHYCNTMIKIEKDDHYFIKTRGYTKCFKEGKSIIIKCPECKKEQFITLN